jgi:hypothetical protein
MDRGLEDSLYSLNFLLVFLGPSVILASCAKPLASWHVALDIKVEVLPPTHPFPFLSPSPSLPLCIFKPAKLPQPHPPTLSAGGGS